jgi:hypothetical protein
MRTSLIILLLGGLASCERFSERETTVELLNSDALFNGLQAADPSIAVDPESGDLFLAWVAESAGEWDLYFARSSDGGESFSSPVRVNDVDGDVYPHSEGAPRLVVARGVVALFWSNQFDVPNRTFSASDLRFTRSTDRGATWESARNLQDESGSVIPGANTFHGAAWDGASTLVVAWLDGRDRDARRISRGVESGTPLSEAQADPERFADESDPHDGDATVYAAFSHDLGATWEAENRRIQGSTCPCCRISLAADPQGEIIGSWRGHFGENFRDPAFHLMSGPENGAVRIHADNWEYPGCPHSGPAIAVGANEVMHAAWYTGAEGRMGVHYATFQPGAAAFSAPFPLAVGEAIPVAHPSLVALADGGAVVAHNVDGMGRRVIVLSHLSRNGTLLSASEVPGSEGGTHPQSAVLPDGRVVIAWTQSEAGLMKVRLARLVPGEER